MHYVLFLEFLQGHEKTKDGSGSKVKVADIIQTNAMTVGGC